VNSPKKIIPKIIGLIINPSTTPNFVQSLFKERSKSGCKSVTARNRDANTKKRKLKLTKSITNKKIPHNINTDVKKNPNLRLEGNSILENIFFIKILYILSCDWHL
jgi:hypothetical protein